jgi:hypothetical protein
VTRVSYDSKPALLKLRERPTFLVKHNFLV